MGQGHHTALGGGVRFCLRLRHDRPGRGDVDDRTAVDAKVGNCRTGAKKGAAQVDRDHAVKCGHVLAEHVGRAGVGDGGVVDQKVDPAACGSLFHQGQHRRFLADIRRDEIGTQAAAADQVKALPAAVLVPVGQENMGTGGRERQRDTAADPLPRSGDDRRLAFKVRQHLRQYQGILFHGASFICSLVPGAASRGARPRSFASPGSGSACRARSGRPFPGPCRQTGCCSAWR